MYWLTASVRAEGLETYFGGLPISRYGLELPKHITVINASCL